MTGTFRNTRMTLAMAAATHVITRDDAHLRDPYTDIPGSFLLAKPESAVNHAASRSNAIKAKRWVSKRYGKKRG